MPKLRPGRVRYVTNGGSAIQANSTQKSGRWVGVAVKQKAPSWDTGYANSKQTEIAANEPYLLVVKGQVEVADPGLSSPAVGDAVYITSAGVITKTATANTPFGSITCVAGSRGCPTGFVRIDLDIKTSVAADTF